MVIHVKRMIENNLERLVLLLCMVAGSVIYATDVGLSRKFVVVLTIAIFVAFRICKNYGKREWHKYFIFTIIFWFIAVASIRHAYINERIAVAGTDDVSSMYPAMLYISRLVREAFKAFFSNLSFSFPMWEWTLGMGENTIASLNFFGLGDPFYLLAAFFSEQDLPYFFTFFLYLRMYLGGIFCIIFLHELDQKRSNQAYVLGALVYSFSSFAVYSNIFIIFVQAMMYTPMLLWGAERVLQRKKKGILLIATFLYALSGFYFLYISSISLGIYVLYRLISQRLEWKEIIRKILELVAEYLVGLSLAAFVFLPSVLGYFSSSRAGTFQVDFGFMSFSEIAVFLFHSILPYDHHNQMMSMCAIAIMSIILVMFAKKKVAYKINIILLFICMITPIISTIMSGGANYDRWEIVVILYASYLTFILWDELGFLTWMQKIAVIVAGVCLYVYGILYGKSINENQYFKYNILIYAILLVMIILIYPLFCKRNRQTIGKIILFTVVVATIYETWELMATDWELDYVREDDVVHEIITDDEKDFYRIDYEKAFGQPRLGMNISLTLAYPGISQYYSIENKYYVDAFGEWETGEATFCNQGLDYRTVLETLAGVKYFIAHAYNQSLIPFGFEKENVSSDGEWVLYKNKYALPIAYTYDKVFDSSVYNQDMNGLEKQNVMLQAAAVEEYSGNLPIITEVEDNLSKGEYQIISLDGIVIEDGIVYADSGSEMIISAMLRSDCENYLYFDDNMDVEITIDSEYIKNHEKTTLGIVSEDEEREIKIKFEETASFPLDNMNVYHFDFSQYERYISSLNDGTVSEIKVDTNQITCNISVETDKMLCIAAPYESGWSAKVDGEKAKIYRMNSMYMGIEISEGEHTVELYYITPGLVMGVVITAIAMIVIVVYGIWKRKKKKFKMEII